MVILEDTQDFPVCLESAREWGTLFGSDYGKDLLFWVLKIKFPAQGRLSALVSDQINFYQWGELQLKFGRQWVLPTLHWATSTGYYANRASDQKTILTLITTMAVGSSVPWGSLVVDCTYIVKSTSGVTHFIAITDGMNLAHVGLDVTTVAQPGKLCVKHSQVHCWDQHCCFWLLFGLFSFYVQGHILEDIPKYKGWFFSLAYSVMWVWLPFEPVKCFQFYFQCIFFSNSK